MKKQLSKEEKIKLIKNYDDPIEMQNFHFIAEK